MTNGIDQKRLVIFTSGWTNTERAWGIMRNRFEKAGYDVLVGSYQSRGFGPIEDSAEKVAEIAEAASPNYDETIFVGHSMGGLVSRYAIQKLGVNADAYASFGTPHRGHRLRKRLTNWFRGVSESMHQMSQDHEFIEDLNQTPWPKIPALSLSGSLDNIVRPNEASFEPNSEHIDVPLNTHVSLIMTPRPFYELWSWLTFEIFDDDIDEENTPAKGCSGVFSLGPTKKDLAI